MKKLNQTSNYKYSKRNTFQKESEEINNNNNNYNYNSKKNNNNNNEPLYDLFLSEYNDLYENILSLTKDKIITKIIKNISRLLGKEKFESYSSELILNFKNKLIFKII